MVFWFFFFFLFEAHNIHSILKQSFLHTGKYLIYFWELQYFHLNVGLKNIFSVVPLNPGKWRWSSLNRVFHWGLHRHSVVSFNYHFPDSTIIHEFPCVLKKLWAVLANVMAHYEAQLCSKREGVIMHWSILLAYFLFDLLSCQWNAELFIQNLLLLLKHCA